MRTPRRSRIFLFLLGLLFAAARPAYAYGDIGSGTLFWQLLVAALAGLALYLRRLLRWWRGRAAGKSSAAALPEK